jgi:hypothetical protein
MDMMGYKSTWSESDGDIPTKRINIRSHIWDKAKGEHFFNNFKYKDVICRKIKKTDGLDDAILDSRFAVTPAGDIFGHMMIEDNTTTSALNVENKYPIMPNYVRDLAGRIICIAECFPNQKESVKNKLFPQGAFCIDEKFEGYDLLENVFFSSFRTLDMSPSPAYNMHSGEEDFIFTYNNPNLHPYKLRVDTFYQDGWKLPQTEMLFVKKPENILNTDRYIAEFLKKWEKSENKHDYEAFYEECGSEEYFNELFENGVTLIPTLEGYNADAIVDREFNLVDYHQGKYVAEFHDMQDYADSDLPAGTIVKVLEPGFLAYNELKKAKVLVSNGVHYESPNKQDPDPLYPDVRLPHSRTSAKWGDLHIPTHPKHFEHSSIWGWSAKSGMFLQEKGPIWDPLHYFYESVDLIIHYYQDDVMEDNRWLFEVPKEIKTRFYPVIPFAGYDILDSFEKQDRLEYIARPYTLCKRYDDEIFTANIGYHPMPPEFEYEIDPWTVPDLAPMNRVMVEVPLNLREKIASVVQCNIPSKKYLKVQNENSEGNPYWMYDANTVSNSSGVVMQDYPYLARYLENLTSKSRVKVLTKPFLDAYFKVDTNLLLSEYISSISVPNSIDEEIRDITVAFYDLKEKSFNRLKNKNQIYNNYYDDYVMGYWNCSSCDDLIFLLKDESIDKLEASQFSHVAIMQPPTF